MNDRYVCIYCLNRSDKNYVKCKGCLDIGDIVMK